MNKNGFTLVELVIVIILLGIISAITLPRFFNNDSFTSFFDRSEFESALNWTRNRAVTSKCAHEFRIDSSGWSVLRDDDRDGASNDNDCASMGGAANIGDGCSLALEEYFSFIGIAVTDGSGNPLSGTEITSANLQRLIFTADGKLYRLTTPPANASTGCTDLESENPVANNTPIVLNGVSLTVDGATAYVALQ